MKTSVFINEFHYDNIGTDSNEFIEIAGPAGTDLTGWSVLLYNGAASDRKVYNTQVLTGSIQDSGNGFGTVVVDYPVNGIQNGAPDGIALVNASNSVVQFLSYEGFFVAADGPAANLTSIDIGVDQEPAPNVNSSLQLTGTGTHYEDFTWIEIDGSNTKGATNAGQTFVRGAIAGINLTQSGGTTEVNEAGETTDTYTLALNTNPVGGNVTVTITADAETRISQDGVNFFGSVVVSLTDTTPKTITVKAVNDIDVEGEHTSTITHNITSSSDPAYSNSNTPIPNLSVKVLDNDVTLAITKIHTIQGSGASTPLTGTAAQDLTIEGIVVGDFQGVNGLNGFYVQEEDIDTDNNPLTSEGIFVFAPNAIDVKVGDKVQLNGDVSEQFGQTQISNLNSLTVLASDQLGLVTPSIVNLPESNLESYEGMLVTFQQTLTVTEHFQLGRFGQVVLSSIGVQKQPTDFIDPRDAAAVTAQQNTNNLNRIFLDDGSNDSFRFPTPYINRTPNEDQTLRIGSSVDDLTGVLGFGFGAYRVQRNPYDPDDRLNQEFPLEFNYVERPAVPTLEGDIKVASFNVLNYFTTLRSTSTDARGADNAVEFARQQAKIVAALTELDADVVGLIEIENNGPTAVSNLVNALNAEAGAGTYAFIADPAGYTTLPGGNDAIKVGFIYKPGKVTPVGASQTIDDVAFSNGRAPVAQTFIENATGQAFTPIINHFKSKSGTGTGLDADQGDGQGNFNQSRRDQATALLNFVSDIKAETGDGDVMVLGDLNAYSKEDPIRDLQEGGLTRLNTPEGFLFGGQIGSLDHALVTSSLLNQVAGATKWNVNAFEPLALDYNDDFRDATESAVNPPLNDPTLYQPDAYRSSDHDPVLVGLELTSSQRVDRVIIGTNQNESLFGTERNDLIRGLGGNDRIFGSEGVNQLFGDDGDDTIYGGSRRDEINGGNGRDLIYAGEGNNLVLGGNGNDTIYSGSGDDLIHGGRGSDTIFLGGGRDVVFLGEGYGADTINNFQLNRTKIGLVGLESTDLKFVRTGRGAEIRVSQSNELLATLTSINSNQITAANFSTFADFPTIG